MSYVGALLPEVLSEYLTDEELTRAKNLAYNELLNVDSVSDAIQQYGPQYLHLGRKMTRTEMAQRVAAVDAKQVRDMCKELLVNKEPSFTSWGPISTLEKEGGLYAGSKVVLQNMLK